MVWGAESLGASNLALRLSGRVTGQVTAALSLSLLGCKFGPSRGRGLIIKEDNMGKHPGNTSGLVHMESFLWELSP